MMMIYMMMISFTGKYLIGYSVLPNPETLWMDMCVQEPGKMNWKIRSVVCSGIFIMGM